MTTDQLLGLAEVAEMTGFAGVPLRDAVPRSRSAVVPDPGRISYRKSAVEQWINEQEAATRWLS